MRPLLGDDAFSGRSRSTSVTDNATTPIPGAHQPPQMACFLADEKTMEAHLEQTSLGHSASREHMKRSNFGVESLATTTCSLINEDRNERSGRLGKARNSWNKSVTKGSLGNEEDDMLGSRSTSPRSSTNVSRDLSPSEPRRSPKTRASQPFTPLNLESPLLGSIASGPSSRRNSEVEYYMDEVGSQAIVSSGDEDTELPSQVIDSSSASQLVMPSISMPSRRPFTEKGKYLGRLKVLIAGDSGVGKTSLIKAIVQTCKDIVHVDPLSSTPLSLHDSTRKKSRSKSRNGSVDIQSTLKVTEVYASTRSYPHWWSEFDNGKVLKRRKSSGEPVLERNLCFVDTPGYGNGTSCMESITPVVQYVESHLEKCLSPSGMNDSDIVCKLSGNGSPLVDVVFYLILNRIKPVDIEYLRRLAPMTNVIPLIAQADTHSPEKIESLKASVCYELESANIRTFKFGSSLDSDSSYSPSPPYAISTAASSDDENMDASLLMSPDYIQPLVPTELAILVEQIFDQDNVSWLRHSAAKKCLQWRRSSPINSGPTSGISQSLTMRPSLSLSSASQIVTTPIGATNTYNLARITDHTQREERLAQVRLSKWASDLQRSLQNERARFEALARGERAVWLTERLNECVQDGTLVPISAVGRLDNLSTSGQLVRRSGASGKGTKHSACRSGRGPAIDANDPLGLVQLNVQLRRRSWATLRVVGGFGIIGGLTLWIARSWVTGNGEGEGYGWGFDWGRLFRDW